MQPRNTYKCNVFLLKAKEKPQVETEERPRGNIACSLYVRYFRAGGNCVVLLVLLVLCVGAQVTFYTFAIIALIMQGRS